MDISDLIYIVQFGIYTIIGFMFVLVVFFVAITTKTSKNTQSTINSKYKNDNNQAFKNNYEEFEETVEEDDNGPIQNL